VPPAALAALQLVTEVSGDLTVSNGSSDLAVTDTPSGSENKDKKAMDISNDSKSDDTEGEVVVLDSWYPKADEKIPVKDIWK
jgi:hypothetical protein